MLVRRMNRHRQNTTGGIRYNMVLSTLHFLPAVKARLLDRFGRAFDALTVNDPRTRFLVSTVFFRTARRICAFTRSKHPVAIHFM